MKCLILLNFNIELNAMKEYLRKGSSDQAYASNAFDNSDEFFDDEGSKNLDDIEEILYSQLKSVKKANNNNSDQAKGNEDQASDNENQNKSNPINVNFSKQEGAEITKKRKAIANDKLDANMLDKDSFTNLGQRIHK